MNRSAIQRSRRRAGAGMPLRPSVRRRRGEARQATQGESDRRWNHVRRLLFHGVDVLRQSQADATIPIVTPSDLDEWI